MVPYPVFAFFVNLLSFQSISSATVPDEKKANGVTAWTVCATRKLDYYSYFQSVFYGGTGSVIALAGLTVLVRGSILRDPAFIDAYANDTWMGKRLSTGDDVFLTRWMLMKNWKTAFQNAPEAEVFTPVYEDSTYLRQNIRWGRSILQHAIRMLFHEPGFSKLVK